MSSSISESINSFLCRVFNEDLSRPEMPPKIIRAGWIQRESTFLKRWKENWFVLYRNGILMYFDDPNSAMCEGKIQLSRECLYIRAGTQVRLKAKPALFISTPSHTLKAALNIPRRRFILNSTWSRRHFTSNEVTSLQCVMAEGCSRMQAAGVTPPVNRTTGCLLSLKLQDGVELNLCAKSTEDMALWNVVLADAIQAGRQQRHRHSVPQGPPPPYTPRASAQQRVVYPPTQRTQIVVQPPPVRRRVVIRAPLLPAANRRRNSFFW